MLGVSVYLGNDWLDDIELYLEKMAEAGFTSIFTSLHIPEDDPALYSERLKRVGAAATHLNMELMADISPKSLGHLGFTWENAEGLLEWGLTGLRVDYGVDEKTIAALSQKMKVALNASTLTEESLAALKEAGLNTAKAEAWHNFYPRPETGLDREDFTQINRWLREEGLTTMAFVPGDGRLRGPLYAGLPTLEDHRGVSPLASFLDLTENGAVDKVLIGDVKISERSLEQFKAYQEGVFLLEAVPEQADPELLGIMERVQTNRTDAARDCIRSMESRLYGLAGTNTVQAKNTAARPVGSITIDNERYGRYRGEIQITKRDLAPDEKVNVLGRVVEHDRALLSYMRGGAKFLIQWG